MNRKWTIAIVTAAVLLVATVGFAYAKMGHGRGDFGFFGEHKFAELEARLKLTPDQSKQIRAILKDARDQGFDRFAAGSPDRVALAKAVFSSDTNQAEIQKNMAALEQQHQQMLQFLVATGTKINAVLTPEQRVEMQKIIDEKAQAGAKMRARWRERMQQHDATPGPQ